MGYRLKFGVDAGAIAKLRQASARLEQIVPPLLSDAIGILQYEAVQNLSGVPFQSRTGTHTINKRSGRGAASIQTQYPYGSPYKARLFAGYMTRYANNPEQWNILAILEYGRGEVRPKYTPSAKRGMMSRAALTISGGTHELVSGQKGFRGTTGRYVFAKSLPPMQGKYWMQAAVKTATPKIQTMINKEIGKALK